MNDIHIRQILPQDNAHIATIIRNVLSEFGANKPGTVFFDPTTDDLFSLFQHPNSSYFIASINDTIVGGSGIFPTAGLPENCCELVKLYLSKNARGRGLGKLLMQECFTKAKEMGFEKLYLETMPELNIAVGLYEQQGFTYLTGPMGKSGHFGCNIWMVKNL
jgi:putative acetyltransferase